MARPIPPVAPITKTFFNFKSLILILFHQVKLMLSKHILYILAILKAST
jgi:hypothetical protein